MDLECCRSNKSPNFQIPCCPGCSAKRHVDPCLGLNLDCKEFRNTPYTNEQPGCSGHLNFLEKKKLCCEMQCSHREEKLTGYKTLPYALPIPHYMGHRPLFPHPLPPNPHDFMGCHTSVENKTACCPQEDPIRNTRGCY